MPAFRSGIDLEISMLEAAYLGFDKVQADPEIGLGIVKDTLRLTHLDTAYRSKLEWYQGYFGFWIPAREAICANDQVALDALYPGWVAWNRSHAYPYPQDVLGTNGEPPSSHPNPDIVVKKAIDFFGSTIEVPRN